MPVADSPERICRLCNWRGICSIVMASNYNDIEKYRRHAVDCIALVRTATDAAAKLKLLDMAQGWLLLAEQGEKNGETILFYETPPRSIG